MKNQGNLNLFFIGFIACILLFVLISAKSSEKEENMIGKYQVGVADDKIVILNTVTGEFILDDDIAYIGKSSKSKFRKGKFDEDYIDARDH